jgi:hypothetical protein
LRGEHDEGSAPLPPGVSHDDPFSSFVWGMKSHGRLPVNRFSDFPITAMTAISAITHD